MLRFPTNGSLAQLYNFYLISKVFYYTDFTVNTLITVDFFIYTISSIQNVKKIENISEQKAVHFVMSRFKCT